MGVENFLGKETTETIKQSVEVKNAVSYVPEKDPKQKAKQKADKYKDEKEANELLADIEAGEYGEFNYEDEASKYKKLDMKEMTAWKENFTDNLSGKREKCKELVKQGEYQKAYADLFSIVNKGSTVNFLLDACDIRDQGDGFQVKGEMEKDAREGQYGVNDFGKFDARRMQLDKTEPKTLETAYTMTFLMMPTILDKFLKDGAFK